MILEWCENVLKEEENSLDFIRLPPVSSTFFITDTIVNRRKKEREREW